MNLAVKNMVCPRCIEAVTEVVGNLGLTPVEVTLGRVVIAEDKIGDEVKTRLNTALKDRGFELIESPVDVTLATLKQLIVEHVRSPHTCRLKLSDCLESQLNTPYDTLSRLFSAHEGMTIEKFHIATRIVWVKELMHRGDLTISEIAHITGYSSLPHLSRQFKSIIGMTPSEYIVSINRQ